MTMKIKNEHKVYVYVIVLHVLGWVLTFLFGRMFRPILAISSVLWGIAVFLLCRNITPERKRSPIRRGLLLIEISNLIFVFSLLVTLYADKVLFGILGGILWEILGFAGVIVIFVEFDRRRKAKKAVKPKTYGNKTLKPVQKPCCRTCGKTLDAKEKDYCTQCKYDLEHTKCSCCNLYFQKEDLQIVEEAYYCKSCFAKKFADLGKYGDEQEKEIQTVGTQKKSCFSMIKDMFGVDSKKKMPERMIKKLCENHLFVIYTLATNQPLCYMDRLCAYDSYEKAVKALDQAMTNGIFKEYFYPLEIKQEDFSEEVKKYLCSGFDSMIFNDMYRIRLVDLPVYDEDADYGSVCPTLCNHMMSYKEHVLAFECDEAAADRERSWQDSEKQKALFNGVLQTLGESILLLPEEPDRKKVIGGKTQFIVFTDPFALKAYNAKDEMNVNEVTMDELYRIAQADGQIHGVIVNPEREAFQMKISIN